MYPNVIEAQFPIARTWKQPRCPSTDEWIKKLWYIYTMEYYSAINRNEFESVLVRWMSLEPFRQSEVSQKEKQLLYNNNACIGNPENGTDEPICGGGTEPQTRRTDLWTQWGKERMGRIEGIALKHTHYHV